MLVPNVDIVLCSCQVVRLCCWCRMLTLFCAAVRLSDYDVGAERWHCFVQLLKHKVCNSLVISQLRLLARIFSVIQSLILVVISLFFNTNQNFKFSKQTTMTTQPAYNGLKHRYLLIDVNLGLNRGIMPQPICKYATYTLRCLLWFFQMFCSSVVK